MTMKKILKIKEQLIKNRRELNIIAKNENLEFDCLTNYKNEAFVRAEVLNEIFNELALELKAKCIDDDIYCYIMNSIIIESEKEETVVTVTESIYLTLEDLKDIKKDIGFVEARLISYNDKMTVNREKSVEVDIVESEELTLMTEVEESINEQDKEFWNLVRKEEKKFAHKARVTLAEEIFGCKIDCIQNSKAREFGEDEYGDLENSTYDDTEIWKTINETNYQVSTFGRVRNTATREIVKEFKANGMMIVKLENRYLPVAALVFSLFNNTVCKNVEHIDKDITNNNISNLKERETLVA